MPALSTAGRVLFALPFAVFGVNHLLNAQAMAGAVPIPGGAFWIYFTGIAMLAASIGILTKVLGQWAALGLALLLWVYVVAIHIPGLGNPQTRMMATVNLLKDVALSGGALTWAGLFAREHASRHVRTTTPAGPLREQPAR